MVSGVNQRTKLEPNLRVALCVMLALVTGACAGASRPDAAGPRAYEPPYPIILNDDPERRVSALAAWAALMREQGLANAPAPEFQPVIDTVRGLPTLPTNASLRLPKVGEGPTMTEEETRESLRRFISAQSRLFGFDPMQLSLVERTDAADGTKKARYAQRPFSYPLRGGYGALEISFAADRRILQISSTIIPEAERLGRALALVRPREATVDDFVSRIAGQTFTYRDAAGNQQALNAAKDQINVRGLVVYPIVRTGTTPALEIHLAWEVTVGTAPARTIYFDAVRDEIIGAA